jgi:hypothetical protein
MLEEEAAVAAVRAAARAAVLPPAINMVHLRSTGAGTRVGSTGATAISSKIVLPAKDQRLDVSPLTTEHDRTTHDPPSHFLILGKELLLSRIDSSILRISTTQRKHRLEPSTFSRYSTVTSSE